MRALLALAIAAGVVSTGNANVGGIDVTVKKDGKAVSRARTDASGNFATGNLEPGSYNVEFRAPNAAAVKGQLAISVLAGKQPPRQASADGKHLGSGVALNVDVTKASKLTGKVSPSGKAVAETSSAVPAGYERVKANVKIINGKRHIWVAGPIGSNMGGRWVEEGSEAAALSTSNKRGGDGEVLTRMQDHSGNVGERSDLGTPDR